MKVLHFILCLNNMFVINNIFKSCVLLLISIYNLIVSFPFNFISPSYILHLQKYSKTFNFNFQDFLHIRERLMY